MLLILTFYSFLQKTRTPVVPADTYITELRKLTNHDKSKAGASPKKSAKNSSLSLSSLLRKLKVDLKMSHERYVYFHFHPFTFEI